MRQLAVRKNLGPLVLAALILSGCSGQDTAEPTTSALNGAAATDFADRMAGTAPPAPPGKAFAVSDKSDLLEFAYAYPAQAASVPAIVAKFDAEVRAHRADALKMAKEDSAAAKSSGFPFHGHSLETTWSVKADTPRFLVLGSETYSFTGGAHGMTGYGVLLWDKARKRETSTDALMTSPAAFAAAIKSRFCAALDAERAQKRGAPVVPGDDDFTKCIDPMKEVLVPTSKDGQLIDGVTVVIGPYSAGPYAEGSYEVALPVDQAMRQAIKTEYQGAFTGG